MAKLKCNRCGKKATAETIQGWLLCNDCELIYNNILNENREKKTLRQFRKEITDYQKRNNDKA